MIHQTENQFALTPSIRCTDQAVHIGSRHELFEDSKLLSGAGGHLILPLLWKNGKVGILPLSITLIVAFRGTQFHQMPHAPADQIAVALQIAIFTLGSAQDFGKTLCG